nr:twin-arginine translocation signal domain-containing protein [Citrobacter freundii]
MSISRRNFLRGVGIGCSACAIGSFPPGALARNSPESIKGKTSLTPSLCEMCSYRCPGNDSNLLIVFYVQIMPDDFVMQLHRF